MVQQDWQRIKSLETVRSCHWLWSINLIGVKRKKTILLRLSNCRLGWKRHNNHHLQHQIRVIVGIFQIAGGCHFKAAFVLNAKTWEVLLCLHRFLLVWGVIPVLIFYWFPIENSHIISKTSKNPIENSVISVKLHLISNLW